jgi:hypothetical protein
MAGDYLVRRSANSESEILCVNDNGEAANFTISYIEGVGGCSYVLSRHLPISHIEGVGGCS